MDVRARKSAELPAFDWLEAGDSIDSMIASSLGADAQFQADMITAVGGQGRHTGQLDCLLSVLTGDGNFGDADTAQITAQDAVFAVVLLADADFAGEDLLQVTIAEHQHGIFIAGQIFLDKHLSVQFLMQTDDLSLEGGRSWQTLSSLMPMERIPIGFDKAGRGHSQPLPRPNQMMMEHDTALAIS